MKFGPKSIRKRSQSITMQPTIENVDWDNIRRDLKMVYSIKEKEIRELEGVDEGLFKRLVTNVKTLYSSPDEYDRFHKIVTETFADHKTLVPGTVGAYFAGCLVSSNVNPKGCSQFCAGAMPLSRETAGENSFCEYPIFLASSSSGRMMITQMNQVDDMTKAIVYVNAKTVEQFEGFSTNEIQAFQAQGIETVKLLSNDLNPVNLMKDVEWVKVEEVKTRATDDERHMNSGRAWTIVGIILIALLVLFVIYLATRS